MTWPIDDLSTESLDAQSDRPSRLEFFKIFQRVKSIIRARGRARGIASLGPDGKIPVAQLPQAALQSAELGVPNGAASLDGNGDVPLQQIPGTIARLGSPRFSGNPTGPTPPSGDNSGRLATTRFVRNYLRIASITRTATVTTGGGLDEIRQSRDAPGSPGRSASANAKFTLPEGGRVLLPVKVSLTGESLANWTVSSSIRPSEIVVAVRSTRTGPQDNNQTLTIRMEYERLESG